MNHTGGKGALFQIVRLRFHQMLAYPLGLLAEWGRYPITLLVVFILYSGIFQANPSFGGTTFIALFLMLSLSLTFRNWGNAGDESYEIQEEIKKGEIFIYLTRPMSYFWVRLSRYAGKYVAMGIVSIPLIYVLPFVVNGTWAPISSFLAAIVLCTVGGIVLFQIYYITGILSFWFEETWGFRRIISTTAWLLSGSVIPIAILPDGVRTFAFIVPFQHQAATPALFMLGQVGWDVYAQSLFILLTWIIVLGIVHTYLWRKGLLKYDGKG